MCRKEYNTSTKYDSDDYCKCFDVPAMEFNDVPNEHYVDVVAMEYGVQQGQELQVFPHYGVL